MLQTNLWTIGYSFKQNLWSTAPNNWWSVPEVYAPLFFFEVFIYFRRTNWQASAIRLLTAHSCHRWRNLALLTYSLDTRTRHAGKCVKNQQSLLIQCYGCFGFVWRTQLVKTYLGEVVQGFTRFVFGNSPCLICLSFSLKVLLIAHPKQKLCAGTHVRCQQNEHRIHIHIRAYSK